MLVQAMLGEVPWTVVPSRTPTGHVELKFMAYVGPAFALEYMLWLWVPLLLAAAVWHFRRNGGLTPLLLGGVSVAHALYVAAIGG